MIIGKSYIYIYSYTKASYADQEKLIIIPVTHTIFKETDNINFFEVDFFFYLLTRSYSNQGHLSFRPGPP